MSVLNTDKKPSDIYKFRVKLNWHGELFTYDTHATSKEHALLKATYGLSRKLKRTHLSVWAYFSKNTTDNHLEDLIDE